MQRRKMSMRKERYIFICLCVHIESTYNRVSTRTYQVGAPVKKSIITHRHKSIYKLVTTKREKKKHQIIHSLIIKETNNNRICKSCTRFMILLLLCVYVVIRLLAYLFACLFSLLREGKRERNEYNISCTNNEKKRNNENKIATTENKSTFMFAIVSMKLKD